MPMLRSLAIAALALSAPVACVSAQQAIDQDLQRTDGARWFAGAYEVSCDQVGVQGVQILQVFSVARKPDEAIRESRRNAVRAMVFRGVSSAACNVPPLIRPPEFTRKADRFFDTFFKEGGQYLSYVEYSGDEVESRTTVGRQVKIGTTVIVQVGRLRRDLEGAGIISSMGDLFGRPPQ